MGKMKNLLRGLASLWYVKYVIVIVLGMLFVGIVDDNSLRAHLRNKQRIEELDDEIDRYQQAYMRDQTQLGELRDNPKAVERIARERYFMKADDEDIFVLREDESTQPTTQDHEPAE